MRALVSDLPVRVEELVQPDVKKHSRTEVEEAHFQEDLKLLLSLAECDEEITEEVQPEVEKHSRTEAEEAQFQGDLKLLMSLAECDEEITEEAQPEDTKGKGVMEDTKGNLIVMMMVGVS
jgi:signal recognition particle GTPase